MTNSRPPEGAFHRNWRPTLMWWLVITVAVPLGLFVTAILAAFAFGVWRSVMTGTPMPDLFVGLDRLPWQFIAMGIGTLVSGYLARGRQITREMEINGGGQGRPPFAPSSVPPSASAPAPVSPLAPEPMPDGGLVNNQAIHQ